MGRTPTQNLKDKNHHRERICVNTLTHCSNQDNMQFSGIKPLQWGALGSDLAQSQSAIVQNFIQ